ncbi:MAG TPA: TRAP transporter large permease [Xanthobacteraceae bacterium]
MEISLIGFAILLLLIFLGLPLGFAMILVGVCGFAVLRSLSGALAMSSQQIIDISLNFGFSVLPLFVLMGAFVNRANLSQELYDAANSWLGHRRGGLAMATVAACGGFAAISGSSLATAATMTKVAMPPMRRYGYDNGLAAGTIAAGGTLGILIPPSVPMVIYGILTETDIGELFVAGIIPGILLIVLYCTSIAVVTWIDPKAGPKAPRIPLNERWPYLAKVWGVAALFFVVMGGIYGGIFTPTEAASIGAFGAMVFVLWRRRLTWPTLIGSLVEAGRTTGTIFAVGFGALIFSNFVTIAGLPRDLVGVIRAFDLPAVGVVLMICLILIILGMIFDALAMILLTVPVFFPIVASLGLNPVWFGIIIIIVVEIGLITPPIGLNVFVVKSIVNDVPLGKIFRGIVPFFFASIVGLLLIIFYPPIALVLPSMMR